MYVLITWRNGSKRSMENWTNDAGRERTEVLKEKPCPNATSSTTNSTERHPETNA